MSELPPDYFSKPVAEVDPEVAEAMEAAGVPHLATPTLSPGETAAGLRVDPPFDPESSAARGRGYERLDQLVVDHLLGAR